MTRRTFTQTFVAGAGAISARMQAAHRLKIGIGTYTYHGVPIDGMIARLSALSDSGCWAAARCSSACTARATAGTWTRYEVDGDEVGRGGIVVRRQHIPTAD